MGISEVVTLDMKYGMVVLDMGKGSRKGTLYYNLHKNTIWPWETVSSKRGRNTT